MPLAPLPTPKGGVSVPVSPHNSVLTWAQQRQWTRDRLRMWVTPSG